MKRFITNQGIKAVDTFGERVTDQILSELFAVPLTEHRNKLAMQANAALENYVERHFKTFPTVSQVRAIRALLEQMKDWKVFIEDMPEILEEVCHSDVIELNDEPFERQINEQIARILERKDMPWEQYL
jgi:hypothetical protein